MQSEELHCSPEDTSFDEMIEVWRAQVGVEATEWSPGECCWLLPVWLSASQVSQGGGQVPAEHACMIRQETAMGRKECPLAFLAFPCWDIKHPNTELSPIANSLALHEHLPESRRPVSCLFRLCNECHWQTSRQTKRQDKKTCRGPLKCNMPPKIHAVMKVSRRRRSPVAVDTLNQPRYGPR